MWKIPLYKIVFSWYNRDRKARALKINTRKETTMLDEYKQIYNETASLLPDRKKLSKSDLFNLYIKNENNESLQNACLAEIIIRFWKLIGSAYSNTKLTASPEQCYDWLIDSVLYILKNKRWLEEDSTLHGDPNWPDKAVKTRMSSLRSNFLKAVNTQKRSSNIGVLSIEEIDDEYDKLYVEPEDKDDDIFTNDFVSTYVLRTFNKKDYFSAFILDAISDIQCYFLKDKKHKLNRTAVANRLRSLETDPEVFAYKYDLDVKAVEVGASYVARMSDSELTEKIVQTLRNLKHIIKKEDLL